jgi:crotonobetainyl-CoA:carnitine CoA-transferase CaiB-like acyl-CoA transferase
MVISPVSGQQVAATLEAVGHPEWIEELKRLPTAAELTSGLFDRLQIVLPTRSTSEWETLLAQADVPASPVANLADHLSDPQVVFNQIYRIAEDRLLGPTRRVRHPARFDGSPAATDDLDVPALPQATGGQAV